MPLAVCARTTFQGLLDNSSLFSNVLRHLLTCLADSKVIYLEVLTDVFLRAHRCAQNGKHSYLFTLRPDHSQPYFLFQRQPNQTKTARVPSVAAA
jgi:hypothetical protein